MISIFDTEIQNTPFRELLQKHYSYQKTKQQHDEGTRSTKQDF